MYVSRHARRCPRRSLARGTLAFRRLGDLAVGERGARGLPAGEAAAAAAGVRRRAAVVQAADRRPVVGVPGRRAHVEELLERELAVEDVAADEAVLLLHLVGADDVAVQDRGLEVRGNLVVEL